MNRIFTMLVICLLTSFTAFAQSGQLVGKVTDENNLSLPGATVMIVAMERGSITDMQGNFLMTNLPAGEHELKVTYMGFQALTRSISIEEDKTLELSMALQPGIMIADDLVIIGERLKGQAKALSQQKQNANITNVVSADQVGRFPDANVGDALKRVPGITMQNDQGEARNIIIRGIAPQLNSVTLNGERIPSAEGDNRNIQMDLIPADMIQTIQVNKAVTPDMDADAIGGSVNLVTRAAPAGRRVSVTGSSGMNLLSNRPVWTGGAVYGQRMLNGKVGVVASGSHNFHEFGSDNVEAEWSQEAEDATGEDVMVNPYMNEFQIRTYQVTRQRASASASFDFQLAPGHTIYLKGLYSDRKDWENRFRLNYKDMEFDPEAGTYTSELRRETKGGIDNATNNNARLEHQTMQSYRLNGDHLFGAVSVDWSAGYARAMEKRPNERYVSFRLKDVEMNQDIDDTAFPFAAPKTAVANDELEFKEITEENQFTAEQNIHGRINLRIPMLKGRFENSLKLGGSYRLKTKVRDNDFSEFEPTNEEAFMSSLVLEDQTKANFLAGSQYEAGNFAAASFLGGLDLTNDGQFEGAEVLEEFAAVNYSAQENILSSYLMLNQKLGDKLSMIAGLRMEHTSLAYEGFEHDIPEDGEETVTPTQAEDSYTNFLPAIHLKYEAQPNSIIRFAWTNTLARPNYYDLVPYRLIIREDAELEIGNASLKPTTSMNFDLMAEHYFQSVGIVSLGAFQKTMNNFIYSYVVKDYSEANSTIQDYELVQPRNGDQAMVYGLEASFQRQLDFLPGALKGLGIYSNYTYTYSEAEGVPGREDEKLSLPGTAPHMFNASLSYEMKGIIARVSLNYAHDYLDELGGEAFEDRFYDRQMFVDFNASYAFNKNLRVFVEANNLTNQPLRYYQGDRSRTMQMEYYNARFNLGLKFDMN